jgi:pimeloyl-ACP methyl ester carboxylesterase
MKRRQFLQLTGAALAAGLAGAAAEPSQPLDAAAFRATRSFAELRFGRIAYVERGSGRRRCSCTARRSTVFSGGARSNGSADRRCIARFHGPGATPSPRASTLAADAQSRCWPRFSMRWRFAGVDIVASDSGGAAAQLFVARYPKRVRTLLLTNCDVEPDSPPPKVKPVIEMARAGTLAEATAKWIADKALARSTFGAAVFRDPSRFADETIEYYVTPLVSTPLRRAQYHAYHVALEPNPLAGIEATLKRSKAPVRIVWGAATTSSRRSADYLDRTFPNSRGIRRVPEAKLFFPEEFPDVIADEARRLWRAG